MTVQPLGYGNFGQIPPSPWQIQAGAIAIPPAPGTTSYWPAQGATLGNPNDPLAWIPVLMAKLYWQAQHAAFYDSYYSGDRANLLARKLFNDVFGETNQVVPLLLPPEANLGKVGIDAVAERLTIEGFRVGTDLAQPGAAEAWQIWLDNNLDVMWPVAQVESLVKGVDFLLLWQDSAGPPVISVEDPTQTVVHRQNVPPYEVDAGMKVYFDEWTAKPIGYLWRPGVRYQLAQATSGEWSIVDQVKSPSVPPLYELANRTRLMRAPTSELAGVTPLLDVYTLLMADLVVAADTGAFPIRTATGITLFKDPKTGEVKTPFDVRVDKAMVSENPNAKYGTLPASDLAGYIAAINMVLQQVRMLTRAPEHYYGQGANTNVSGEALKSSESPLVKKVEGIQVPFGWTARRSMQGALTMAESKYAQQMISPTWGRTETRVEAQDVDAGQKLEAMGVPLDIILTETIGMPPELVARAMNGVAQRTKDAKALIAAIQHDAMDPNDPAGAAAAAALFRGQPGGALSEIG